MKKFSTYLSLSFAIMIVCITFASCNKDVSDNNFVGTYETYSAIVTENGETKTYYVGGEKFYGQPLYSELMVVKLNENGTCRTLSSSGGSDPDIDIYDGTWELIGSNVILTMENGSSKFDVLLKYENGYLIQNWMSESTMEIKLILKK